MHTYVDVSNIYTQVHMSVCIQIPPSYYSANKRVIGTSFGTQPVIILHKLL